jgi:diguanylate cyclase (GGDEF)-like protein
MLATISQIADVDAVALATAEPHAVTVHILVVEPLARETLESFARHSFSRLEVLPGATVDVIVHGDADGTRRADVSSTHFLSLPLRGAGGALAVLARDPAVFADVSYSLVESIRPYLALVLDNARLYDRMRALSAHDSLTGMLNHRAIHERLAEEIERARRYKHPLSVVICDLDHFKRVNDGYGHMAGDAVLRHAAQVMRRHLRSTDAFGRYGGEEFLAVLPENDLEAGRHAAERLRSALAGHRVELPGDEVVAVTGSFGVAASDEVADPTTADALVALADTRLYEAKRAGRNRVRP